MARKTKSTSKSVYERIEDKLQNIKETEELLVQLNNELQELYTERDNLQMSQLFEAMKTKGLDINEALALLHTSSPSGQENNKDNSQNNEQDKPKKRNKKETVKEVKEEIIEENNLVEE